MTEEEIVETPTEETTPTNDTVDLWITTTNIINFQSLKPQQFGLQKTDATGLDSLLSDWIVQCQDLINTYTHRQYNSTNVPPSVQNVLLRLVSNMVSLSIQRRDSPIIKVNDWTVQTLSSDIFSDDLKDDLKPFIKDSSNDYSKIGFFAITGADSDGAGND